VLKKIRKHNKWFMAGFGVLLMVTWLVQPAFNQFNAVVANRPVAKLDGKTITVAQMNNAGLEVGAVARLIPGFANTVGLDDPNKAVHWLLLSHEAEEAGLVGGPQDGEDWNEPQMAIAMSLAYRQYGQLAPQIVRIPQYFQPLVDQAKTLLPNYLTAIANDQHLRRDQLNQALAKGRGIARLIDAYRTAARMGDRQAVAAARDYLDAAKVDYVFIPSERLIDSIPDPDAATLQAHFDKYKGTKPGEGDYGIGYLLPARLKLEWMKLDRKAIEDAISLDPIEVRKRYNAGHSGEAAKYPKDFATERPNVEREMTGELVDKAMNEAQIAIQTEVLKATNKLEPEGKYKKLPADWDKSRPHFEQIAQAVVDAVKKQTGLAIPLPAVTIKAKDWLTRDELRALPEIGYTNMRLGGRQESLDTVLFWTKELPGAKPDEALIPVQTNLPLAENFFTDGRNRFYVCVLDTKGESAPDSIDERRDQIVKDYKKIQAFDQLKGRAEELRSTAISGGLDAIVVAFPAAEAPKPEKPDEPPPTDAKYKPLQMSKDVSITRDGISNGDTNLTGADVNKLVLEAAAKIDPLTPRDKVPADTATLSIPVAKHLGLAVIRILAPDPVTKEKFREYDRSIVQVSQNKELTDLKAEDPFSLTSLLTRHKYTSKDRDIRTIEDLKKDEKSDKGS
jgi:hypothetical protein